MTNIAVTFMNSAHNNGFTILSCHIESIRTKFNKIAIYNIICKNI